MIKNYLKIAWRNVLKNKLFSAINVFGLSVGMTCCMLLLLYIQSEISFDQHHEHINDLYLLRSENVQSNGEKMDNPRGPAPYAQAVKMEFPEVVQVTRLWQNFLEDKSLFTVNQPGQGEKSFYETKGIHADSTFFDVFTYEFVEGDPKTSLNDAHSVVLSEAVARKIFGSGPALDKTIRIGGKTGKNENFRVTGVFKSQGDRSHIDANYFVSLQVGWVGDYLRQPDLDFTNNNMFYHYLRLKPGTSAEKFSQKLPSFIEKYARKDLKIAGYDKKLALLPVKDIHLFSKIDKIVTPTTSTTYLYVLASIAIFTLLIACINFMNLATARSAKRAAEVGMRKVMGAGKSGLIGQFLGESMVLTFLALIIAAAFVILFLPIFNQLSDKTLSLTELLMPEIIASFVVLAFITGLLAGSYPAFYLSVFNPLDVIKGKFVNSVSATALRRGLVVFQFVISIGLVVATMVIQGQIKFMQEQPLGFAKEQQIVIPFRSEESRKAYTALRNELLENNQITAASGTSFYPGILNPSDMSVFLPGQSVKEDRLIKTNWVAPDFMQTMGFQMAAGRMFSAAFPGDTNNKIVVNQATLRKFAIPLEKAVGQHLDFNMGENGIGSLEIVGVVKDFHYQDLHKAIEPYAFFLSANSNHNYIIAHVNTKDVSQVLPFMESKWKSVVPGEPFSYTFLDQDFQSNYAADARTARIVNSFTIISILISCLGLFGLAAFAAQQRIKEIGVRKVLGASISSIVGLLSGDFIKLVIISMLIATPLTWYIMNQWLQDFAYKISIQWWMFAAAGALAVIIAMITVSTQAIKAAITNPVKSLKSE
ncbi:ABC transporter permease [Dyadobacter chenwenxiniae]|uniref:ABC transporter permease n=1 Tax=Dyadobacter chenwenxiniae TaxID=2906456 RepID=A0A9X1TCN5_9BACT|nr:ABC transporter permease [Dyadobacter chenwenxiniae]MCF0061046.1 ABC transporter permease [Dyadobacter chenwenxiniae]UON80874.1 ABC transporter permease [Dyadobacter chenwenxiniae]